MSLPPTTTSTRAHIHNRHLPTVFPARGKAESGFGLQLGTKNSQNPGGLVLIKGLVFVNLRSLPRTQS